MGASFSSVSRTLVSGLRPPRGLAVGLRTGDPRQLPLPPHLRLVGRHAGHPPTGGGQHAQAAATGHGNANDFLFGSQAAGSGSRSSPGSEVSGRMGRGGAPFAYAPGRRRGQQAQANAGQRNAQSDVESPIRDGVTTGLWKVRKDALIGLGVLALALGAAALFPAAAAAAAPALAVVGTAALVVGVGVTEVTGGLVPLAGFAKLDSALAQLLPAAGEASGQPGKAAGEGGGTAGELAQAPDPATADPTSPCTSLMP